MSCPAIKSIRLAAVFGAATVLGACALPVPLQVVSLMADGISYMTTQKSIADHGLSAVTGQDCALLRGLSDGKPCRVIEDGDDVQTAEGVSDDVDAGVDAKEDPFIAAAPSEPVQVAALAVPVPNPNDGLYLIVGSFVKEADAVRHATRMNDLLPKILYGKVKGVRVYRVGVGPLAGGQLAQVRKVANGLGVYDAWAVNVTLPPQVPEQAPETVAQLQANIPN